VRKAVTPGSAPRSQGINSNDEGLVHERVYRRIRYLILSGSFVHGARLPSSRALAKDLGISRNSVLTALERLIADGFLEARDRSGVYVSYTGNRIVETVHSGPSDKSLRNTPFALGWPTEIFPVRVWNRLQARCWRGRPERVLQQADRNGLPSLRKAIAGYLTLKRGLECSASHIAVTTSIPDGIGLAIRVLDLSKKEFWVEQPCCPSILGGLLRSGARLTPVPVNFGGIDVRSGLRFAPHAAVASLGGLLRSGVRVTPVPVDFGGIDVAFGLRSAPHAAAAFISPTRQGPTGVTLTNDRRDRLAQWATRENAWIFEDDFNWNGDGTTPAMAPYAAAHPDRTIYFSSFNHLLFPGLRVAYLVAPTDVVDRIAATRGHEGDVNAANQAILADFIDEGHFDAHLRQWNSVTAERRSVLSECVHRELSEFLTPYGTAGAYFICGLNNASETEVVTACAENNLVITGMSEYYLSPPGREEIVLGPSQFSPTVLREATTALRGVFESIRR